MYLPQSACAVLSFSLAMAGPAATEASGERKESSSLGAVEMNSRWIVSHRT
mgnify:CR=1 FL=1